MHLLFTIWLNATEIDASQYGPRFNKRPAYKRHNWAKEHQMTKLLSRFYKDESGATAIEYGLIATLIAIAIIVAATTVGPNLASRFNQIATSIGTSG
jgi:pilus assembly protein Flp/PilA